MQVTLQVGDIQEFLLMGFVQVAGWLVWMSGGGSSCMEGVRGGVRRTPAARTLWMACGHACACVCGCGWLFLE